MCKQTHRLLLKTSPVSFSPTLPPPLRPRRKIHSELDSICSVVWNSGKGVFHSSTVDEGEDAAWEERGGRSRPMNIKLAKWSKLQPPAGSCNLPEVAVCRRLSFSLFLFAVLFPASFPASCLITPLCSLPSFPVFGAVFFLSPRSHRDVPPLGLGSKSGEPGAAWSGEMKPSRFLRPV